MSPQNFKEDCPVVHVICEDNRGVNQAHVDLMLILADFTPGSPAETVTMIPRGDGKLNRDTHSEALAAARTCGHCVVAGECMLGDFFRRQNT